MKRQRRQAAWVCFESYLSYEQLLQAIQILERGFQAEGTINLIAYVAKVCMEFGIDLPTHKLLYGQFYKLMSEKAELLVIDPLSLLQGKDQTETVVAEPQNILIDEASLPNERLPKISLNAEETADIPAHTLIFVTFMRNILEYAPDNTALFAMLNELAADKKLRQHDLVGYIRQWTNNSSSFDWADGLSQQTLTRLVHLVYMALCEVLGPVATDDCFHKVLAICERRPEARIFPPSQFL